MVITRSHLIYDINEIASSGGNPNEFKITLEEIGYWVDQTRAQLIGQSLNKRDDVNDSWVQYINCLELEQVDASECCDVDSGCFVLRSVKEIPSTIDTWRDNWIISVTSIDGTSIPKSNPIKQRYQKFNKYTGNKKSWYIKNNRLYVINDQILQFVNLAGIFESPTELENFVTCTNQQCYTDDSPYPISFNMASQITDIIIKTKVQPFMTFPEDNRNDANSQTPQQRIQNKQSE